jgi:hypothetical protein
MISATSDSKARCRDHRYPLKVSMRRHCVFPLPRFEGPLFGTHSRARTIDGQMALTP